MVFTYKYKMGIQIKEAKKGKGVVNIPDPSSWKYQVGDLDTSGSRDATGLLHRAYVATKINYEFEWKAIEWEMLQTIIAAVQKEKFWLIAPDPRTFNTMYGGNYYVGDRTGNCAYYITDERTEGNRMKPEIAVFDLKLKFIEY